MSQNIQRNESSSRVNLNYLLSSIQEDLLYAKWGTVDFNPLNSTSSSMLSFKAYDLINLVRYYQSGNEVGKDINMTGYNAITQKTVQTFEIRREDLPGSYRISIRIRDIYGYTAFKIFTSKKRT